MINLDATHIWIVTLGALVLWMLLAWAEWRRYGSGPRWGLRILLLFLAIGGLLGAYLRPGYQARAAHTTILLNGAAADLLDSLQRTYPAAQVLSLYQPYKDYPPLEGMSYLPRYAAPGSRVLLLGEGLAQQELLFLQNYALQYVPGKKNSGLHSLNYESHIGPGDSLVVQGVWSAATADEKLVLTTAGLGKDSVFAAAAGPADFLLRSPVFFGGDQVYTLYHIGVSGDTLEVYRLPLQVGASQSFQLALLTAYPAAESKYLKEHLSNYGYRLQYTAQLAPGKSIDEWVNLPRKRLQYTPTALAQWDVLLLSMAYYNQLSATQLQNLGIAMQKQGLGMLIVPDSEQQNMRWQGSQLNFGAVAVQDTVVISGVGIPLAYRPILRVPAGWEVMLRGSKGIAAVRSRYGLGQLAVSGITNSYTLRLKGNEKDYQRLWSHLLELSLPLNIRPAQWKEMPVHLTEHMPAHLGLYSQDSLPSMLILGPDQQPITVPFWQHYNKPNYWQTTFWPLQQGWHTAIAAGDTAQFWVAHQTPSLYQAQLQNRLEQAVAKGGSWEGALSEVYMRKPVPEWWFFVLFLTGMCGLWLEKKVNS
ncbi:MAG: hypothetical protein KY428_04520 [Bacteroidetes bacterium]|nr:hypothetical protein [Bacteroidota bacterium]